MYFYAPLLKKEILNFTILVLFSFSFLSNAFCQNEGAAVFILSGSVINGNEKPIAGVLMVLKKSNKIISQNNDAKPVEGVLKVLEKDKRIISTLKTDRFGKYSVEIEVSTTDINHEYVLDISHEGTVPKSLTINTYIPPSEYANYNYGQYEFDLEIDMTATNVQDIILEHPSGKIKWDSNQHKFDFDQVYAKIYKKEQMLLTDESYLQQLSSRKKLEKEQQAAEEAKRNAEQAEKEKEANRIVQQNLEAIKNEIIKKNIQDSLAQALVYAQKEKTLRNIHIQDSLHKLRVNSPKNILVTENPKPVISKVIVEQVPIEAPEQITIHESNSYAMKVANKTLKESHAKMNQKKAANLSAKYETNNALTSLLNTIDEKDKVSKVQPSSLKTSEIKK